MQTRSGIALGTLLLFLGLFYFGRLLPDSSAGPEGAHPHEGIDCQKCHSFKSVGSEKGLLEPRSQKCLECHSPSDDVNSLFHGERVVEECASCHSFHKPELVMAEKDTMRLDFAVRAEALCLDCHKTGSRPPEVSSGHRLAAQLIHSQRSMTMADAPSEFCLSCHGAGVSGAAENEILKMAPRFHVNASHVFGRSLVPGAQKRGATSKIQDEIPSHLFTIDGKIECQTCHSLVSAESQLLSMNSQNDLCNSCHDLDPDVRKTTSPILTQK